jgi:hypothetical protein
MALAFETEAHTFDLDNAFFLARACDIVALKNTDAQARRAVEELELQEESLAAFDVVDEEGSADYHGMIGVASETEKHGPLVLLAFADVDGHGPWLTDQAMMQRAGFGGLIHKGFADALDTLWSDIEPALRDRLEDQPLWIAGHGLGGALAVLAAARLQQAGNIQPHAVYTFGAPRVGNLDFFYSYAVSTYRLVNNNDIITHVPAEVFPVGGYHYCTYKHVGTVIYFDRHGQMGEGTTNWGRKKELVHERLLRLGQPPTQWFQDHHLSSYLEVLEKNL